jgi:NTP pyrophosphatase (non-canonical NTP hydrolase)
MRQTVGGAILAACPPTQRQPGARTVGRSQPPAPGEERIGLVGEAGEFADKVKKLLRNETPITDEVRETLALELGDVLWYVATIADKLDWDLEQVARHNLAKLADRKARGVIKSEGDTR